MLALAIVEIWIKQAAKAMSVETAPTSSSRPALFDHATVVEHARLAALYGYNVLDSASEKDFDDIARMAAQICDTPLAAISFVDHNRVWVKAGYGVTAGGREQDGAFCGLAMRSGQDDTLVIRDTFLQQGWNTHPLVASAIESPVRFYACAFLHTADGARLGTLAVLDTHPRDLPAEQLESLRTLASMVMQKLELRRALRTIRMMSSHHEMALRQPDSYATALSNDLKTPLSTILSFHDLLKRLEPGGMLGEYGDEALDIIGQSAQRLATVASKMPAVLQTALPSKAEKEWLNMPELITETLGLLLKPAGATVRLDLSVKELFSVRDTLQQILLNLCSNAFRFIAKPGGELRIALHENHTAYLLYVTDNGPGIPSPRLRRIYDLLYSPSAAGDEEVEHAPGRGLGLPMVKRLATRLGGSVLVDSQEGVGTTFRVRLPKGE